MTHLSMRFSIITCTYNSEQYVQNNIDSVVSQTYGDFEHIFIDGFSTDRTVEIITAYQQKYPDKVTLFQSHPKGISHAMNEGIKKARGTYLVHLHSDDSLYDAHTLQNVEHFLTQNHDPDWIYGKAEIINATNGHTKVIPHDRICNEARFWQMLVMSNYLPHQSIYIKKSVFERYGMFSEDLKKFMDYDLWLHLLKNGIKPLFFNEVLCHFSVRVDSQSVTGRGDPENVVLYKKYVKNPLIVKVLTVADRMRTAVMHKMSAYKIAETPYQNTR